MVACVAGHGTDTLEVLLIDRIDHQQHSSRCLLERGLLGKVLPTFRAIGSVAIDAVHIRGSSEHAHRVHELVDGNSFDDLNVLEDFFSQLGPLLLCCLAVRRRDANQADDPSHSADNRSLQWRPRVFRFVRSVNEYC